MTDLIDLNKKYSVGGLKVIEIFHYPDNNPDARLIAHIKGECGDVFCRKFYENGQFFSYPDKERDLIPVTQKIKRWFNVYSNDDVGFFIVGPFGYDTERDAESDAISSIYTKTICIEVEV